MSFNEIISVSWNSIVSNKSRALLTMLGVIIGLVAGGWVGDGGATYAWVHRELHDKNAATLTGTLPPILNTAILAGVTIIGTVYLLLIHDLSQTQSISDSIFCCMEFLEGRQMAQPNIRRPCQYQL